MTQKHFLQTKYWAEVRSRMGQQSEWVDDNLLIVRKLPLGLNVGYMPQVNLADINWQHLTAIAKQLKVIYIHLDPNDKATYELPTTVKQQYKLVQTKSLYYRNSLLLDLSKDEQTLLQEMKQRNRYNINLAERKGVKVEIRDDAEALEIFLKLFFTTVKRQKYFGRSADYYRQVWQVLQPQGKAKIAISFYEGQPLDAWMLFTHDGTIYYPYGGSSNELRNLKSVYALLWELAKWGKANGYHYFDFWGILPDGAKEGDEGYGFHQFKIGFGGEPISYYPALELVISPILYYGIKFANSGRWAVLRLKQLFRRTFSND